MLSFRPCLKISHLAALVKEFALHRLRISNKNLATPLALPPLDKDGLPSLHPRRCFLANVEDGIVEHLSAPNTTDTDTQLLPEPSNAATWQTLSGWSGMHMPISALTINGDGEINLRDSQKVGRM